MLMEKGLEPLLPRNRRRILPVERHVCCPHTYMIRTGA